MGVLALPYVVEREGVALWLSGGVGTTGPRGVAKPTAGWMGDRLRGVGCIAVATPGPVAIGRGVIDCSLCRRATLFDIEECARAECTTPGPTGVPAHRSVAGVSRAEDGALMPTGPVACTQWPGEGG